MSGPTGDEVAAVYAACADRIAGIAPSLDDAQLATPVPATPKWTVIELLCHLVGGPADVCAGRLDGVATDPWTQAQVEARHGRSVAELLEEWSGLREQIDGVCRSGMAPALAFDVATHEQDLRGALDLGRIPDPVSLDLVTSGLAAGAVGRSRKAELPSLQLRDGDGWSVGDGGGVSLTAPKFELFRLMMGRRSGRQAAAMDWSGDPSPYLDLLCPFGPLRDSDVHD
ncbi:MAG TPA: maleylpyruvate isomerase N-terminal domain-containing protein [Mycobacteriales bacterium]|nr:maleylpyruvate isomerase N-terminal domain-containing protein [Mycobacteriales bacterium]